MSTSAVTLDAFPFIGPTPGGGVAKVTGFGGWLTTGVRRGREVLTGRHGGFSSPGLAKPREMTLSSLIRYDDAADCAAERRALLALGGFDALPMLVTDAGGELSMTVVIDESDVTPIYDRLLRVQFDLVAGDPFARSTTPRTVAVASGATVSGVNGGTAAADLLITLTSTGTVVLTVGGVTLTTTSLPSGTVIDTGSPADSLFPSLVLPIQMPALPAGGGSMHQAGTANLSVVIYDTYA